MLGALFDTNLDDFNHHACFCPHTGDFEVSYDMVEDEKVVDLIVEDDFFVHYFTVPEDELAEMKSLSKHIIFLLDVSDSMSGPKLEHAKQVRTHFLFHNTFLL